MILADFRADDDPETIPDEWWWERIRLWRDAELRESDWTQLADAPVDATVWAEYRQALRDMTDAATPAVAVFPPRPA